MAYDPVNSAQQLVRRAGQRMREAGILSEKRWERQHFEGEQLEDVLAYGRRQVARLAGAIESYTGSTLEGRRALDYGCGTGRTAVALATRCEHVYGLDIMEGALRKADEIARELRLDNVEWLDAARLPELSGRFDLVVSMWVFQHIPTRQGERIFAAILDGLASGGVGAVHFTVRPPRTFAGLLVASASAGRDPRRKLRAAGAYGYLLMNSYSLNRLGTLMSRHGVSSWEARWWYSSAAGSSSTNSYPSVTLIFRKDQQPAR